MKATLCNGKEVTAWKTQTPGLVAVSINAIDGGSSSPYGWGVIHAASGKDVAFGLRSRDQAKDLAARLGELPIDWTADEAEVVRVTNCREVQDLMRAYFTCNVWGDQTKE